MSTNGKVVINLATGLEDPERVTVAFLVAGAAAQAGKEVTMFVTKEAVRLALPNFAQGIASEGCPTLPALAAQYAEAGGRMLVCPICFNARKLSEEELIDNAQLGGATPLWQWIDEAPQFSATDPGTRDRGGAVTFIEPVSESQATGAVADMYQRDREAYGELPNFTRAFSPRPGVYAAWRQLNEAIKANMEPRRYELATLAAARRIGSSYCMLAHGSILIDKFLEPDKLQPWWTTTGRRP